MPAIDIDAPSGMECSTINLRVIAAMTAFSSKDENRYYLKGVMVEFDASGAIYIATDGTRMLAYWDERETGENKLIGKFIIPTSRCKSFKIDNDDGPIGTAFADGPRLVLAYGFTDIHFAPIDGPYPNWRRIIPQQKASGATAQYDMLQLADFRKLGVALDLPPPFLAHNGSDAPAFVWYPGARHVVGIIMPLKNLDELSRAPPEWTKPRPADEGDIEDRLGNVENIGDHKK